MKYLFNFLFYFLTKLKLAFRLQFCVLQLSALQICDNNCEKMLDCPVLCLLTTLERSVKSSHHHTSLLGIDFSVSTRKSCYERNLICELLDVLKTERR